MEVIGHILQEIWLVTARMASFLLLGFLVAGFLSVFISATWLERHLGGRGLVPVFKASLFGVPLPLCSCGVIPVAASLRQHGASKPATVAFLLSTPQTGVDSIMVTWTMMGPLFAIFRPVAALVTGILGGSLVQMFAPPQRAPEVISATVTSHGKKAQQNSVPVGLVAKLRAALDYALITLPGDIGRALLFGVLIAGVLAAVIPADFLSGYLGEGALSIALMMIVGIPIYVCATASVPLATSFIFLGASPGAALAFLIAGPATNAATLTTISRVLGRQTMVIYLLTVAISAFGGGLLLDWLLPRAAEAIPQLVGAAHMHEGVSWFDHLCGALLVVVMSWSWWVSRKRNCGCDSGCGSTDTEETSVCCDSELSLSFIVKGMNCSHCSASVIRSVSEMAGVSNCLVELETGLVSVTGNEISSPSIIQVIESLGYSAILKEN